MRIAILLAAAAAIALPLYLLAVSPYAPALARALNVPRDGNVGLLAGPLSALGIPFPASPPLPRVEGMGRNALYVAQGLTDVGKNLAALAVIVAVVAGVRRLARTGLLRKLRSQ